MKMNGISDGWDFPCREQSLALRAALEGAQGETPAAPPRRLTEAQRLVMLWPGDKCVFSSSDANPRRCNVQSLPSKSTQSQHLPYLG